MVKTVFVVGPRRSGTNFLETLVGMNFSAPVADLNRRPVSKPVGPRLSLFEEMGNKHDITPWFLEKVLDRNGLIFAVVRNPIDWLIARGRFQSRINPETADEQIKEKAHFWMQREWNGFVSLALDRMAADASGHFFNVFRYEDLLVRPRASLEKIAEILGENVCELSGNVERELAPNGTIGKVFEKPDDPFACYDRNQFPYEVAVAKKEANSELAGRLNYELE